MFKGGNVEQLLGLSALRPMRNAEGNLYLKSMMPIIPSASEDTPFARRITDKFVVTQNGRGHGDRTSPGVAAHRIGLR